MRYLPPNVPDPNLLVGIENSDDGSVYRLTDDLAVIQSVDFFTPVVDDPYMFGQIAAANSLSDIYAMGGTPITALNIVGFPINVLGPEVLAKILQGSSDKVREAGAQVIGGHSVDDREPKFGLSVTGTVHPNKFYTNNGAKPGDKLILTKPLGIGALTTGIKRDLLSTTQIDEVTKVMTQLNKYAAEILRDYHPNAVTDVTGFGLLGHAYEMATGSEASLVIHYADVPLVNGTIELALNEVFPGGSRANHAYLDGKVVYDERLKSYEQVILCDAITSGGLLISLPADEAESYVVQLHEKHAIKASIIGEVLPLQEKAIYVE